MSASREFLPANFENLFIKNYKVRLRRNCEEQIDINKTKLTSQEHNYDDESDRGSIISVMRKTKSIDASCLDMRSLGDVANSSSMHMPRAKSEFNLTTTTTEGLYLDFNTSKLSIV